MQVTRSALPRYTIIEHTADTGFEVSGETLAGLFENAGRVLFYFLWDSPFQPDDTEVPIRVSGQDPEELLVSFLEEFIYLQDTRELVFTRLHVEEVGATRVAAMAWGHPFRPERDQARLVVKAVTYHQILVRETDSGWMARVVLDI